MLLLGLASSELRIVVRVMLPGDFARILLSWVARCRAHCLRGCAWSSRRRGDCCLCFMVGDRRRFCRELRLCRGKEEAKWCLWSSCGGFSSMLRAARWWVLRTQGRLKEDCSCPVRMPVTRSMASEALYGGEVVVLPLLAACLWPLRSVCCGAQGRVLREKQRSTIA